MPHEITHVVQQGDYLSSIARKYGFADWKIIYDHPKNKDFKKKRPNPNIIYPGDELIIPPKEYAEKSVSTDKKTKVKLKVKEHKKLLRIAVKGYDKKPLADKKYEAVINDDRFEGKSKSDGVIEIDVKPGMEYGELRMWTVGESGDPDVRIPFGIGYLDPVEEPSGVRARLINLGYEPGPSYDVENPEFKMAVEEFQCDHGLKVDGVCGSKTQAKLKDAHGC